MSLGIFDISKLRANGGSDKPARDSSAEPDESLVSDAMEALSAMSLDEMEAALRSIEESAGQNPSSRTYSVDDVYGGAGALEDSPLDGKPDSPREMAVKAPEAYSSAESSEPEASPSAHTPEKVAPTPPEAADPISEAEERIYSIQDERVLDDVVLSRPPVRPPHADDPTDEQDLEGIGPNFPSGRSTAQQDDDSDDGFTFASDRKPIEPRAPEPDASPSFGEPLPFESAGSTSNRRATPGVIKDEIVLALLEQDVVSMSQVFTALKYRKEGEELWRVLADMKELNRDTIFKHVAQHRGYASQDLDTIDVSYKFVDTLLRELPAVDLMRLLDSGLLPIARESSRDSSGFKLILACADPLAAKAQNALLSSPLNVECRFVPVGFVSTQLGKVMEWVEEISGGDAYLDLPGPTLNTGSMPGQALPSSLRRELGPDVSPVEPSHPIPGDAMPRPEDERADRDQAKNEQVEDEQAENVQDAADDGEESIAPAKLTVTPDSIDDDSYRTEVARDRVVKALLKDHSVSREQVLEALAMQKSEGGKEALWRVLAKLGGINREAVYARAASVYAFRKETLEPGRPDHDFVRLTMETLAEEHRDELLDMLILPFEHEIDFETGLGRIIFVTHDPTRPEISKLLHGLDLGRFELAYASESSIEALLDELFPRKNEYLERISSDSNSNAFDLGTAYEESESYLDEEALEAEISRSKLINLFEASLVDAVRQGVSDIHIYPNANRHVEIHFRVDGRLKKWHTEDKVHPEAFLAVVKDNATNVDRFERDMAQDGFIQREIDGALIRFRVSILPIATANQEMRAESIVIRILDDRKVLTDIRKLGMLDSALQRFNQAIRQPHGMVILTGPTGSGKSTTLVAALHQVVSSEVNVLTVEDPVEYIIKGVRQIKLNHKLNLEGALRAILRHDPDIVMVGEMRDKETAELAIKLANTGHLTFSTLHTNDAPAAVSRLYKMGIEPFLIAYAINLVVAQRLIREVCSDCRVVDENPDHVLMRSMGFTEEEIETTTMYVANRGSMCAKCGGHGYKGRRAVCETLYFSPQIRHMIAESAEAIDEDAIRDLATSEGMLTLQDSARELVKMGATTLEEMLRVTMSE